MTFAFSVFTYREIQHNDLSVQWTNSIWFILVTSSKDSLILYRESPPEGMVHGKPSGGPPQVLQREAKYREWAHIAWLAGAVKPSAITIHRTKSLQYDWWNMKKPVQKFFSDIGRPSDIVKSGATWENTIALGLSSSSSHILVGSMTIIQGKDL